MNWNTKRMMASFLSWNLSYNLHFELPHVIPSSDLGSEAVSRDSTSEQKEETDMDEDSNAKGCTGGMS